MKSRSFLLPALALASCAGQPSAERPNVIVILADDLGCGDLSALGCEVLHTPNLDRLCAQGLNLTNGHAAAPTSTPSRYSLMTGLYPWRNSDAEVLTGDANLLIADGQPTLAGMMRQAGYATGAVGKWHLGWAAGRSTGTVRFRPLRPMRGSITRSSWPLPSTVFRPSMSRTEWWWNLIRQTLWR